MPARELEFMNFANGIKRFRVAAQCGFALNSSRIAMHQKNA
jgi:hypothetical protein